MNHRQRTLPLLVGFAVIAILTFVMATKPRPPAEVVPELAAREPAASIPAEETTPTENPEVSKLTPIERFVHQESLKVGKADPTPDETYQRLRRVAKSLRKDDIQSLKRDALNQELENDRRFLSVYLLALNSSPSAVPALLAVALEPLSIQDISSRLYAEELMIRTQALEGLSQVSDSRARGGALENFLKRQDNAFLADQAMRLLKHRRN